MNLKFFLIALQAIFFQSVKADLSRFSYANISYKYLMREPPLRPIKPMTTVDPVHQDWIRLKLNNFDPQNKQSFRMRYLFNEEHFKPGGPIFIIVGGEWTIQPGMLQSGHIYDMAKALNGVMFYTEHRFYGQTRPTEDLTLENLRFLSIDQALADLAHFITFVKKSRQNSGVILVGCSYSGTMVTWFQQKYPHLSNGAWAMSAMIEAKVDFSEFMEVVSNIIQKVGGEKCSGRIQRAFTEMKAFIDQGDADNLTWLLHLCSNLDPYNKLDHWSLFRDIAIPWVDFVAGYNRHERSIEAPCEKLVAIQADTDADAYAVFIKELLEITPGICLDHRYSTKIMYWTITLWEYGGMWRRWYYQTCSQFGWYQSSSSEKSLFGDTFPVDLNIQFCRDMFENFFSNSSIHRNIKQTNTIYGGKNPHVRNVYSTHGEYDPWTPVGADEDINVHSPVVILPGESHCSDINSISNLDTVELRRSKERVFELIQKWLNIPEDEWIKLTNH